MYFGTSKLNPVQPLNNINVNQESKRRHSVKPPTEIHESRIHDRDHYQADQAWTLEAIRIKAAKIRRKQQRDRRP